MALDPRIILQGRTPDIGTTFSNILSNVQNMDKIKNDRAMQPILEQLRGLDVEQAQGTVANNAEVLTSNQLANDSARRAQFITSVAGFGAELGPVLRSGDKEAARGVINRRIATLREQGQPTETSEEALMLLDQNPQLLLERTNQAVELGQRQGVLQFPETKDTRTAAQKDFEFSQKNPVFAEFLLGKTKAGATNINTTIQNSEAAGLTQEQKALGKSRVGRFEKIQEVAQSAVDQNEQLSQLDNIDVNAGITEPGKVQLARVFSAFGANGDELLGVNVANAQAFNAVSGKLLAEALAAQKGPQTDDDARRMTNTLPKISNEADANKFIIGSMRAINDRKVEQARFFENVLETEGTLKNADKKWSTFKRKTPLLSDNLTNRETGLPMFFNEFALQAQRKNPTAKNIDIIQAWRELNE